MLKRSQALGGAGLVCAALIGLAADYIEPGVAAAAQMHRQILLHPARRNEPVVITKVSFRGAVVQPGRFIKPVGTPEDPTGLFLAGDDWIEGLTIYLLNRTNKTVVYQSILLSFPETKAGQSRSLVDMALGRMPPEVLFDPNGRPLKEPQGSQPPLTCRSGETMAIHLDAYIGRIKDRVEPVRPVAGLTRLTIDLGSTVFSDGMVGGVGWFKIFDPQTRSWRQMDRDYFPGEMDRYWPDRPGWVERP